MEVTSVLPSSTVRVVAKLSIEGLSLIGLTSIFTLAVPDLFSIVTV